MDVSDKVAIVTGGGRGIGRAIALTLARNGADTVVADVNEDDASRVAEEVAEIGRQSLALFADVTDQQAVDAMVRKALDRFGRIDILVNNAGIIAAPGWEQRERSNEEDWDMIYEVNVKGVARVTEAVAPHMKERRYGKIVNIASGAGRQGNPDNPPYAASKSAVISITQGSALGLAPYNINVNAICPGLLWTPMHERISGRALNVDDSTEGLSPREVFDRRVEEMTPLKREVMPEDIGNLAAFLASELARNITGQAVNINGGTRMD